MMDASDLGPEAKVINEALTQVSQAIYIKGYLGGLKQASDVLTKIIEDLEGRLRDGEL